MKNRMVNEFGEDKLLHFTTRKAVFYVVDYTERTYSTRSVEVLETYPTDIDPLIVHNPKPLDITTTIFKPQKTVNHETPPFITKKLKRSLLLILICSEIKK